MIANLPVTFGELLSFLSFSIRFLLCFCRPRPDNIFMQMFPEVGGGSHLDGIKGSSEESVGHDMNGINGSHPRKDQST